jgi:flagellar biosynthesis protein
MLSDPAGTSGHGNLLLSPTRDTILDIAPDGTEREPVAVAIRYDRGKDPAPRVVAKGTGHVAEAILAIAREHGIAVRHDTALAEVLAQIELDRQIPVEAYVAVAEVLSYIFRARAQTPGPAPGAHAHPVSGAR